MRKARRISVSGIYLVTDEEDPFVGELARRIKAARARGRRTGSRSTDRRKNADLLADPFSDRRSSARTRPARLRPGRRVAAKSGSTWTDSQYVL
jgi:hypothetical protein